MNGVGGIGPHAVQEVFRQRINDRMKRGLELCLCSLEGFGPGRRTINTVCEFCRSECYGRR